MINLNAIFAASLYVTIICILYYASNRQYQKHLDYCYKKLNTFSIICFSLAFAYYNKIIEFGKEIDSGDRLNYLADFEGRKTSYAGFDLYLEIMHRLTDNFHYVLYFTTFICCVIFFFSYRYSKDSSPVSLFILMCSNIVLSTFVNLKQCFASAFACLLFMFLSYPFSKKRDILCIICILLACSFHSTGYMLVPIFLIFRKERDIDFRIVFISLVLIVIFLQPFALLVSDNISSFLPSLSHKINEYFLEEANHQDEGSIFAFMKGIPYYIAFILGWINKSTIKKEYNNFDYYLFVLALGATAFASTLVSYWMARMINVLLFPISIAMCRTITITYSGRKRFIKYVLVVGSLAFFTLRSLMLNIINYGGY